jgi:thioredoxin-dependent peroxiredoxin
MAKLEAGDKAPSFELMDQSGKAVKLSDFKGKKVLARIIPQVNKQMYILSLNHLIW